MGARVNNNNNNSSIVRDMQAVLILYSEEKGAERVAKLLAQVAEGKIKGYMSVVNLAELYYILPERAARSPRRRREISGVLESGWFGGRE